MLPDLPAIVYKTIVEQHLSDLEVKTLRLVSRECRSWVDTILSVLRPRDFSKSQVACYQCHIMTHPNSTTSPCILLRGSSAPNLGVTSQI